MLIQYAATLVIAQEKLESVMGFEKEKVAERTGLEPANAYAR